MHNSFFIAFYITCSFTTLSQNLQCTFRSVPHNFGCHIACLASHTEIGTMEDDIVVVTDEDFARLRIKEEVAIVEVLVTESLDMQRFESIADINSCAKEGLQRVETLFC